MLEGAAIHFIKDDFVNEDDYVGNMEPNMAKASADSREKPAPKTLTDVLEALVKEEFDQNRRPIIDQMAAEAANRLLAQQSH